MHGLMAMGREIEDGEAAISQTDFDCVLIVTQNGGAAVIGAAVSEGLSRSLEHSGGELRVVANDAKDSTHSSGDS